MRLILPLLLTLILSACGSDSDSTVSPTTSVRLAALSDQLSIPGASTQTLLANYTYDSQDRFISSTGVDWYYAIRSSTHSITTFTWSTEVAYNEQGLISEYVHSDHYPSPDDEHTTITYQYDGANRLTASTQTGENIEGVNGTVIIQRLYAYNDSGQLLTETEHEEQIFRLDGSIYTSTLSITYVYGDDGLLQHSLESRSGNAPTTTTYVYDSSGNLTSVNSGNATTTYGYNAQGRMTQYARYSSQTFTYNADQQLTRKEDTMFSNSWQYDYTYTDGRLTGSNTTFLNPAFPFSAEVTYAYELGCSTQPVLGSNLRPNPQASTLPDNAQRPTLQLPRC